MATAPYGVRLLVGVTVTAIEETRKLPQSVLTYPMTVASQVAHLVMRVQQDVADLVNRGDETLEHMFPPSDEDPEWATFDEDVDDAGGSDDSDGERRTEGRFALYSDGEPESADVSDPGTKEAELAHADRPDVVAELEYDTLTLAQLRARLPSLRVADLEALLAYEGATKARAPFQTLLANRITRATAK